MKQMKRISCAGLAVLFLLSACGGGGGGADPGATSTSGGGANYTFIPPKAGAHLVYIDKLVDNLNNTLNRSVTDDVTAVGTDGSFSVHEEDPSHNTFVSGATDQTVYPTDFQYNAMAQPTSWVVSRPAESVRCAITEGGAGAPSPLALGASWNAHWVETCGAGAGTAFTQSGTLAGIETITVAAGTFKAFKFVASTTWTVNGITRTETSTRWRDASGGDTRTLKFESVFTYSGGTPPAGTAMSVSHELQSYR
jgi:hypothetical protein